MNNCSIRPVHVVAAVIINDKNQVLIARRPVNSHQGGLWEFPGGKLEANELPQSGLARELEEELGISVLQCQPFLEIHHDYPDKSVFLDVWKVNAFSGNAYGRESQEVRWVTKNELESFDFPAANNAILARLLDKR